MDLKKEKIVFCNYQRIDPVRPDPVVQTIADRLKEQVVAYYQGRYESTQYFKPKVVSSVLILPSRFYKNFSGPDSRPWERLDMRIKRVHYLSFKSYYEYLYENLQLDDAVDDETWEFLQNVADVCVEFSDFDGKLVLLCNLAPAPPFRLIGEDERFS
ncbi:unnamed protein product [Ambrosiozyma monospora]|uniref:Unnamed protein product n=1 Tax=Ambrosiozyma monospora TaxID=43982 RepID=A0ACB5SYW1_AMBMO|nr:unnamed protein product [Ambrosiozyma monospora]